MFCADRAGMVQTKPRERGATLLMVTFISTFLLIPIIGTCIDGAIVYWVKARLSAAVDAAALSTGRALSVGQSSSAQITNAIAIGQSYFTANFPPGVMKSTVVGGAPTINVVSNGLHQRVINVTVSVVIPLYFMPILGFKNQTISATGQATRRDANIMMVLDRSQSMNPTPPKNSNACAVMVASAQNFVNQFVDGRDQLGLVTFQTGANVDYAPTLYFKSSAPSLSSTLSSLICGGDTSTAEGLYLGYNQIKTVINQPGALNIILLFTDGQPNTVLANLPVKGISDSRYGVGGNTSAVVPTGATSCQQKTGTIRGAIADGSTETATSVTDLNQTGDTYAVINSYAVPITTSVGLFPTNSSGCSFTNNISYGRQDIAYIPTQDVYGSSTVGYLALDYFPSGYKYAGQIRPDMPRTARWAAFNAADSLAYTIRTDSTYGTIIYTIGLSGNETMAIDQDFMERMANDPRASNYDSTRPQGEFILASDTSQLAQAFQQVASQILRLSK
jgi:hypothetical protein